MTRQDADILYDILLKLAKENNLPFNGFGNYELITTLNLQDKTIVSLKINGEATIKIR